MEFHNSKVKITDNKMAYTKINTLKQIFNYHNHTCRSGYSKYVSDEEILQDAKNIGILMLGFSEHIPNLDLILPDENHKMLLSEVDDYILSINKIKQNNSNMTILSGFEAEFDPVQESFLGEMRNKVDYMILGQHCVTREFQKISSENNPNYPIEYANMIIKGIESGIFDIVAHPDYFIKFRDSLISEENKKLFDENTILASQAICEKAKDMGIPIELNLTPAANNNILIDSYSAFWKVAQTIDGLQVIKGIDVHSLSNSKNIEQENHYFSSIEQIINNKLIKDIYNPIVARQNNSKLQKAYKQNQENALTFETHIIYQIIINTLKNTKNNIEPESFAKTINNYLNEIIRRCADSAFKKSKSIMDEKWTLERKNQVIKEINQILANQQQVIKMAKKNIINAIDIGCETKSEYSNIIAQMMQYQSTKQENQKQKLESYITNFQKLKKGEEIHFQNIGYEKQLQEEKNIYNSTSGFINTLRITLIIILIIGMSIVIGYILYKFRIGD